MKKFVEFSKADIDLAAEVCESFADHALKMFEQNLAEHGVTDSRTLNAHDHCNHAGCTSETLRKLSEKLYPRERT